MCQAVEGLKRRVQGLLQGLAISRPPRGISASDKAVDARSGQAFLRQPVVTMFHQPLLLELGNAHHALGQENLALQRWKQGTNGAEGEKRLFMGLNTEVLCGRKRFRGQRDLQKLQPMFPQNAGLRGVIAKAAASSKRCSYLSRHWPGTRPTRSV